MPRILLFLPFVLFLFIFAAPRAMAWEEGAGGKSAPSSKAGGATFNPVLRLLSFYSNHISRVDADRCPSMPTCSLYAQQAFKKHGFFMGWMMTVDRLIHEGKEEMSVSPLVRSEGKWKIYDPVENNDFWWSSQDGEHHE